MRHIPFPRPYYRTYLVAALVTGLSIAFILNVFQPFGTSQFKHDYKIWILSGYGFVAGISIAVYYWLSLRIIHRTREQHWTIIHETIDMFLCLLFSLLCCYLYFNTIFSYDLRLSLMFEFLIRAASVSILPVGGLYIYLFSQYRDVKRSTILVDSNKQTEGTRSASTEITLRGTNKEDVVTTALSDILYIKSNDNYVILHLVDQCGDVKKHMIRSTLRQMLDQLSGDQFFQCHRSYIINLKRIAEVTGNKNATKVSLQNSKKLIPVSRAKVDLLHALT